MAWTQVMQANDLPAGSKRTVKAGETEILVVRGEDGAVHAREAKCPHAGAPLEKGALCNGRLICPWHAGTFELSDGALVEPPPLRALKRYPVQEKAGFVLIDPEPENQPTLASLDVKQPASALGADRQIVMIGAGAAAAAAVCTLRQGGYSGKLVMVDPVAEEPVDRTVLSKMALSGDKPLDKLPLFSADAAEALHLDRHKARVERLDAARGTVQLSGGESLSFNAALLATGGVPAKLGVPGEDGGHVFTIRHVDDVARMDTLLGEKPGGKQAVLIGDSFIAFEAASALTKRGLRATLVCRSDHPFRKKFGEGPAEALMQLHRAKGVDIKTGAEAQKIGPEGVLLKTGEILPADVVIVAIGVEPALDFAHGLQTAENGKIAVDDALLAAANVWVAGDCASVQGAGIEHWRVAQQHGRRAAQGMLRAMGAQVESPGLVPFFWTAHFGKRFGYVGHAEAWDDLQVDGSLEEQSFLAYYVKGGTVQAVLGCGKDTGLAMLAEAMRRSLTLSQAREAAALA